jgi:hypothetical protein
MDFFMMRLTAISSFVFALLSCGSAFCIMQADPAASKQPVYSDSEGYAVLSQLIDQTVSKSKTSAIDIAFVTAPPGEFLQAEDCLKVADDFQSAAKDFHERNKSRLRLANEFSLKVKYKLTEKADVQSPPPAAPGEQQLEGKFVARFFFVVSAVGFDQTKTRAIAYCGEMCGGGAYHLLVKGKQGWKEIPESPKCEWMSREQDSANSRGTS